MSTLLMSALLTRCPLCSPHVHVCETVCRIVAAFLYLIGASASGAPLEPVHYEGETGTVWSTKNLLEFVCPVSNFICDTEE
jgi:hypothetical protein